MKSQYGLLLAMLLGAGPLIAAEPASDPQQDSMPYLSEEPEQQQQHQQERADEARSAAVEQSGFSSGSVMRSAFTTRIDDREPVDKVSQLDNEVEEVFYFTELRDMEGQTARHRWSYQGEVMAEVEFDVKGPRWRVWSSKRFVPDWTGEWSVSVVNAADEVIAEDTFSYVEDEQSDEMQNDAVEMENVDPMVQ